MYLFPIQTGIVLKFMGDMLIGTKIHTMNGILFILESTPSDHTCAKKKYPLARAGKFKPAIHALFPLKCS